MPCGWEGNGLASHWPQTLVVLHLHLRAQCLEEGEWALPMLSCGERLTLPQPSGNHEYGQFHQRSSWQNHLLLDCWNMTLQSGRPSGAQSTASEQCRPQTQEQQTKKATSRILTSIFSFILDLLAFSASTFFSTRRLSLSRSSISTTTTHHNTA